jgi:hypothetical protein
LESDFSMVTTDSSKKLLRPQRAVRFSSDPLHSIDPTRANM